MSLSPCTKTSGMAVPLFPTESYYITGLHKSRVLHQHSKLWGSSCSAAALRAEMYELTSLMRGQMQKRHAVRGSDCGAISQAVINLLLMHAGKPHSQRIIRMCWQICSHSSQPGSISCRTESSVVTLGRGCAGVDHAQQIMWTFWAIWMC